LFCENTYKIGGAGTVLIQFYFNTLAVLHAVGLYIIVRYVTQAVTSSKQKAWMYFSYSSREQLAWSRGACATAPMNWEFAQ